MNDTWSNNILIAEFMGIASENEYDRGVQCMENVFSEDTGTYYYEGDLWYNKSLDWLLPVVEKIHKLNPGYGVITIDWNSCTINCGEFSINVTSKESKIDAVYEAIIKYIKWYNEQK